MSESTRHLPIFPVTPSIPALQRSGPDAAITVNYVVRAWLALRSDYSAGPPGCYDNIRQPWMLENIVTDREVLRKWLEAGYVENGRLYPTRKGTPQGGIISPCLANLTLDALERAVHEAVPRRSRVNFVRYADDFIITGKITPSAPSAGETGDRSVPQRTWSGTLPGEGRDHAYHAGIYVPRANFP